MLIVLFYDDNFIEAHDNGVERLEMVTRTIGRSDARGGYLYIVAAETFDVPPSTITCVFRRDDWPKLACCTP